MAEDVTEDVPQNLIFEARAARALLATHRRRRRLCAARAEMGAHLGSSAAFGSGCGQAFPGDSAQRASMFITALLMASEGEGIHGN